MSTERKEDLVNGIIRLVTPLRRSNNTIVRTDAAPALKSLADNPHPDLHTIGITMILGEDFNKNKNCHVDKSIQELENELRKLDPMEKKISPTQLAQAIMRVNSLIRHHGYSSSDITFRRDENTNKVLTTPDELFIDTSHQARLKNQKEIQKSPKVINTSKTGDIIMLKSNSSKHSIRSPFLVTSQEGEILNIKKILNPTSGKPMKTSQQSQSIRQSQAFPLKKFFNLQINQDQLESHPPSSWDPHAQAYSSDDDSDNEEEQINPSICIEPPHKQAVESLSPDSLPHIFNTEPNLIEPEASNTDHHYHLQRQIWERQLLLTRLSQSDDSPEPYAAHKSLESLAREQAKLSLSSSTPLPEKADTKMLSHSSHKELHQKSARRKIDEMFNIPQTDGAQSTDVSHSSSVTPDPECLIPLPKAQSIAQLWQDDMYGSDEDNVFQTHFLAESVPDITMALSDTNMNQDIWTRRKRSVSESDLIDTRLYSFTGRSLLI